MVLEHTQESPLEPQMRPQTSSQVTSANVPYASKVRILSAAGLGEDRTSGEIWVLTK